MTRNALVPIVIAGCVACAPPASKAPPAPAAKASPGEWPVAAKRPTTLELHGEQRRDDYYWLREKQDPEVRAYLEAENAYARKALEPTLPLRKKLYGEFVARIKQTDSSVPFFHRGFFYYHRTEDGKQYKIYCRKRGSLDAPEEVLLDLNTLAENAPFMAVGHMAVSDNGDLLAYSTDTSGFRQYRLQIKDLRTGRLLPDVFDRVRSVDWASDNQTLFFTVEDEQTKRAQQLYRHRLGDEDPALVYQEHDERFGVFVQRSRSGDYVFGLSASHTTTEVRYLRADTPRGEWRLVAARAQDHEYEVYHRGESFFIRTNDEGRNFRLVSAPVAKPGRASWKTVIPHDDRVMLRGVDVLAGFLVTYEMERGLPHLRFLDLETGTSHRLETDEPVYSLAPGDNYDFGATAYRFTFESLTTPRSTYDYDPRTRERTLRKRREVVGGHDPTAYRSDRVWAPAADGTPIPVSLVYKRGVELNGKAPLLLEAYGAYGHSLSPYFASVRLSLLDRGVIYAIAHVRGGGTLGKAWHDDGRLTAKTNTFTDFIAVAEHLIGQRYTSPERLVITGASAGGLLMGAVSNMRPDLFGAVLSSMPFVDVLTTMSDESLPLTTAEFEEWGNPRIREHYDHMKQYCPYTNLGARDYPPMLVRTSFNDSQVMYWEPAKYVARMRVVRSNDALLVLDTNFAGGHSGSSGRYDVLEDLAIEYSFVLSQMGIWD